MKIKTTNTLILASLVGLLTSASGATRYFDPGTTTTTGVDNLGTTNTTDGGGTFPNDLWGPDVASYTNWNTATDGTGSLVSFASGDDAVFGDAASIGTATYYVGTHGNAAANSITFGSQGNWVLQSTFSGGGLSGLGLIAGADISVATGKTARIESNLTSGSLGSKSGAGTLEWASNGAFTNGTSLAVNAGTFLLERTHVGTTNNTVTGLGKVAYRGSATPAFGQEWDLRSSTSTFSGGFDLLRGQIRVGANSAGVFGAPTAGPLGTGTFTIGGEGDAVVYTDAGRTLHNDIQVASGAGTKTLLNAAGANTFWNGAMNLDDDLTVETVGAGTSTHNIYNVSGTGGFNVGDGSDATTLRLRTNGASSTYTGDTVVNTGSTVLVGENSVTSENSVMDLQGGTFQTGGTGIQTVAGFKGNGTILTDGSLAQLSIRTKTGVTNTFTGTVSIGNTSALIRVNGINGNGTQVFDSAVGSIGRFDVTNGATALINSTIDASAGATDFVVETGGILGGTGTATGDILVGGNGVQGSIAAGNSIGTFNVVGDVDFSFGTADGNMISEIDADLDTSDLLNVTGDVTFGAGSTIVVENIAGTLILGDTFDLLDWTGTLIGGALVAFDFSNAALDSGLSWDTTDFVNSGVIEVVPEPSAYALLAGMLALSWVMIRRRS